MQLGLEYRAMKNIREFMALPKKQRLLIFYADSKNDWEHFGSKVELLANRLKRSLCYLTADSEDPLLYRNCKGYRVFYVGRSFARNRLFSKLATNVVVMAGAYLGKGGLPKSKQPVHYALVLPTLKSVHSEFSRNKIAEFDSVLCAGRHQLSEVNAMFPAGQVKPLEMGSAIVDRVLNRALAVREQRTRSRLKSILVAPDNVEFFKAVTRETFAELLDQGYKLQFHLHDAMLGRQAIAKGLVRDFGDDHRVTVHADGQVLGMMFDCHLVLSDWSHLAFAFAFGVERPALFVDVPRKKGLEAALPGRRPFELSLRQKIGELIDPADVGRLLKMVELLLENAPVYGRKIIELREQQILHTGMSGATGAAAIEALVMGANPADALKRALVDINSGKLRLDFHHDF